MYLKDSKTVVIKIGSSLLINDKKIVREKWLSEFAKDIQHLQKLKKTINFDFIPNHLSKFIFSIISTEAFLTQNS